ncbi:DUF2007 domain-containing protein [Pseudomonas entomophila]|jgi:hypothetical protein|uniref:putative signal transducing protein n=1 Tax=Pseudomonas entomophila TaxID=312306 RepID=UPI0015E31334|nr:DUF2007 domain-containing protein [Pseudomonas entomophila]MBA1191800.1 DUF2007 domain-containing protein [Pseudomonas entomophila]
MQRIYAPESLMQAQLLIDVLASEGVVAHLAGRHLTGALGELPVHGLLALMVVDDDAERARALIAAYTTAQPLAGDEPEPVSTTLIC